MSSYARDLADRGMAVYNVEYRRVGSGGGWPTTFHDAASWTMWSSSMNSTLSSRSTTSSWSDTARCAAGYVGRNSTRVERRWWEQPRFRPTRVVSLAGPSTCDTPLHTRQSHRHCAGRHTEQVPDRYRSVDPIQNIDPNVPVVAPRHRGHDGGARELRALHHCGEESGGIGGLTLAEGEDHVSVVRRCWYAHPRHHTETSGKAVDELRATHSNQLGKGRDVQFGPACHHNSR